MSGAADCKDVGRSRQEYILDIRTPIVRKCDFLTEIALFSHFFGRKFAGGG